MNSKSQRLLVTVAAVLAGLPALADMDAAIVTQAMPASTGNQDFTDSIMSTTGDCAFVLGSRATTINTIAEESAISFGVLDDENQAQHIATHDKDNQGTATDGRVGQGNSDIISFADAATDSSIAEGTATWITNGIRINWADIDAQEQVSVAMVGGSDVECETVNASLNGTTEVTNIAHGLSAAPHVIIGFGIANASTSNDTNKLTTVGLCEVSGTTCGVYRGMHQRAATGAATTAPSNTWYDDAIVVQTDNASRDYGVTINDIDADTFDIVATAATSDIVRFVSLRCTNGCDVKVGDFVTRSGSGTAADITGMSEQPKFVMYIMNDMTDANAVNTIDNNGNGSESFGIGFAVNNEGTSQYASAAMWTNDADALGVTDTKSVTNNNRAGFVFAGDGTLSTKWSVSSWDSGGVTHNYAATETSSAQYRVMYLALAPDNAEVAPTFDSAPSCSALDDDTYRCTLDADANATSVRYCVKKKDASAPADGAAVNTCSGAVGGGSGNTAATGSSQNVDINLTGDQYPIHDVYIALLNATLYSAVEEELDEVLSNPSGRQYVAKSGSPGTGEEGLFDGASPAIVDGDYMDVSTLSDSHLLGAGAHCVTVNANTTAIVDLTKTSNCTSPSSPDSSRQQITRRFYDVSVADWSDASPVLYCFNNQLPDYQELEDNPFKFARDAAVSVTLDTYWLDTEGDPLTHDVLSLPASGTENGEVITGSFDDYGNYAVTLRAFDECGDVSDQAATFVIGFIMPDLSAFMYSELDWIWQVESIFVANDSFYHQAVGQ